MKIFKVAIIGCGNIFPMHAQSVKGLENAKIVAVCDIKEEGPRIKQNNIIVTIILIIKTCFQKKI